MRILEKLPVNNTVSFTVLFIAIFSIIILFPSCKKNGLDPTKAYVSFQNLIPDNNITAIDYKIDNQSQFSFLFDFGTGTSYRALSAGSKQIGITLNNTPLVATTGTFDAGKYYSIFAEKKSTASFLITNDDLSAPPTGKIKMRFINLSPDAPNIDLLLNGGQSLFTNQAYKTYTDFIAIDPATYEFKIRQTGSNTVRFTGNNFGSADSGEILTVIASGYWNNTTGNTAFRIDVYSNKQMMPPH